MTATQPTSPLPDAVYRMTFGGGVRLHHGGFVVCGGRVAGIGHADGVYEGTAALDTGTGVATFDIDTRVPRAFVIADGLKAGPAGSTPRIVARGAPPTPIATYVIDISGSRGAMTLELFQPLSSPAGDPGHVDAFPEGVYRLASAGIGYMTQTIVVLCGGRIYGLGEYGGRYGGDYSFDPVRKMTTFVGYADLPPGVPLITGGSAGPGGFKVPMSAEAKYNGRGKARFSFSFAARAVDAELTLVKPLPS